MTEIPIIDQVYWEDINDFLSQLIAPQTGGIHYWDSTNPQPTNLTQDDEGLTGWNVSSLTLQRWTGSSWLVMTFGSETLAPLVYQYLTQQPLTNSHLNDLVTDTFSDWDPEVIPSWITNAVNQAIDNIPLSLLLPLLNVWTPASTSPLATLITLASNNGGLTAEQFTSLFNTWPYAIPTWIVNYIAALLANKSWSNTSGEASYNQLLPAFTEWFNSWLNNDILSKLSLGSIEGSFSLTQIQQALDFWWDTFLKAYIDTGDETTKQYMVNIFSSLENKVNTDYTELLNKINTHSHSNNVVPPANFTGYNAWPNTQANSINTYNYPVIIGACVTDRLNSIGLSVFPYDHSQSVWGNYSARLKVVVLPSSVWPDKSGVNNSPNGVTTSSLLAATSNVITINCPDTSIQYATTTSFSHISDDNMYFVYLIWERVYWPDKYIDKPMTGIVTFFKSDNSVLTSTMTTGPSTPANMRYSTFYGHYNGSGEATP